MIEYTSPEVLANFKDDDDRWKRRSKRVVEAIVRTASGLSVVPAGVR